MIRFGALTENEVLRLECCQAVCGFCRGEHPIYADKKEWMHLVTDRWCVDGQPRKALCVASRIRMRGPVAGYRGRQTLESQIKKLEDKS